MNLKNQKCNLLVVGAGGFIGASLLHRLVRTKPNWVIKGLDPFLDRVESLSSHPNLELKDGTMESEARWLAQAISEADIVLPLAAIADPRLYVADPLKVFALDFEANLHIVRQCVAAKTRLIFPSTSEVYGMASDMPFDEEKTNFVQGPIHKERWIYSASKQLLDRVIYAYGRHEDFDYTVFRPFNWIGSFLDHLDLESGGRGRVLVQFLGQILKGQDMKIAGDGSQKRCFTDIEDALDALVVILEKPAICRREILNIGNPSNEFCIRDFGERLHQIVCAHPLAPAVARKAKIVCEDANRVFGPGYQDLQRRVPAVEKAQKLLGWTPRVSLDESLSKIVDYHLKCLFGGKKHSVSVRQGGCA